MAKRGRPVKGPDLVDGVDASPLARQRLEMILRTLAGASTIDDACAALGVNRSRFHELRRRFLAQAAELLEPKAPGPRPRVPTEAELEAEALRRQVVQLKLDLQAAQVREEIALVMPHLLNRKDAATGEKTRRRPSRKGTSAGSHASVK